MGDNSLLPISDEQAKLGQELVKAGSGLAGWFADIVGDFPRDLFGVLIGDQVKAKRIERIAVHWQRTQERLRHRGIDPEPPSLKYAIPILEATADEENAVIVCRKAFPNSFSNGLTVTEQLPRDPKAADELLSVVGAMYTQQVDDGYQDAPRRKAG